MAYLFASRGAITQGVSRSIPQQKVIFFTSLPRVGGHTTITLGLARMLRERFQNVEIWCKPMPEHGHSESSQKELESLGCRVILLAGPDGRLRIGSFLKVLISSLLSPPDLFFTLAMKNLAPILARWTRAKNSIYYHITHDLNSGTIAFLRRCAAAFRKVVFICPATFEEFPGASENPEKFCWIPQLSEIPVEHPEELVAARPSEPSGPVRLGLIGRLTEEKGARVLLDFARQTTCEGELHVAGTGPYAAPFAALADDKTHRPLQVVFHGSYDPSTRAAFLRNFFRSIDILIVPSQDEWETLSMAVLEALQHGVPSIVCRTGGLRSFEHPDLGPAPSDIIHLVPANTLVPTLEYALSSNHRCTQTIANRCNRFYRAAFSNATIARKWVDIL